MINKLKLVISSLIVLIYSQISFGSIDSGITAADFERVQKKLVQQISAFAKEPDSSAKLQLIDLIESLKASYAQIDRRATDVEDLYEAQFRVRLANAQLRTTLTQLLKSQRIPQDVKNEIEYHAQTISSAKQPYFRSPKKALPIEGVKASDWPLKRWESDRDFYNYTFDGEDVLYRGLRLKVTTA
jgi:hypothetical protein